MMDDQAIIDADVRTFARSEAEAAFKVWDAGGDFMSRRAQARSAIDQYAVDRASGHGPEFAFRMQGAALFTFIEMQGALTEQWDFRLELEAAAEEMAVGARRPRHHHIRRVFR